jgi:hypothetical protein
MFDARRVGAPNFGNGGRVGSRRGLKKLQTTELHEWNVTPSQLHLKRPAVMGGAEQKGLRFECGAGLRVFQDLLDDVPTRVDDRLA